MSRERVRVGIIGGGLMGREAASAFGRWYCLHDVPIDVELVAVCDVVPATLEWFRRVPTVRRLTTDHRELLADRDVDVVYVAVPHHLHESLYIEVLRAGKDLLAEKPFGIDLNAARRVRAEAERLGRFVRVSSEFPFLPGALRVRRFVTEGGYGRLLQVRAGFLHCSDLDPAKPANWKRQQRTCGEIGVMGDLGMHVLHLPLRLAWRPKCVYAQLQNIFPLRPDGCGGTAACDTWDNAMLHGELATGHGAVPVTFEMKRLAPGETNTWYIEVLGTDRGIRFSTKEPKTLWTFQRNADQHWARADLGFGTDFKTITGGIFEPGFPDILLQMWASFLTERAGLLNNRLGCVTPDEAVHSHELWAAALQSHRTQRLVNVGS